MPNIKIKAIPEAQKRTVSGAVEDFLRHCRIRNLSPRTVEFVKELTKEISKTRLEIFEKIKSLSKIQCSPYAYVREWFLNNYANYSEQPEFDADGFVIVKTKAEIETEAKAKAAEKEAEAVSAHETENTAA